MGGPGSGPPGGISQRFPAVFVGALFVLGLGGLSARPAAAQRYTVTDLGHLPAGRTSVGDGLSNSGQVVGSAESSLPTDPSAQGPARPFLWRNGGLSALPVLAGGENSLINEARSVNDAGQVVGTSDFGNGGTAADTSRAFLWQNGVTTALPLLSGGTDSVACKINAKGQAVGTVFGDTLQAVLWQNGAVTGLGFLPGSDSAYSLAYDVNGQGMVVGVALGADGLSHGFVWTPGAPNGTTGAMAPLPGLATGDETEAYGINDRGQVVGTDNDAPVLWQNGGVVALGRLAMADISSVASSINNRGEVVGTGYGSGGDGFGASRAFLYRNGQLSDLNDLLPANSGWTLESAAAINDTGQITGYGLYGGTEHAFLLTPLPARDLLWRNQGTGQLCYWYMNGVQYQSTSGVFAAASTDWQVAARADFDGDGHADILWQNAKTGQLAVWYMNDTQFLSSSGAFATVPDVTWKVVAAADFDGDGHPDLLWQNTKTGQVCYWYMNNAQFQSSSGAFATVPTEWKIVAAADFDGDGHPDLVWQNTKTGQLCYWYMNNARFLSSSGAFTTVPDVTWRVAGTADFDGDGHPDLVWQNSKTGQVAVWYMNNAGFLSSSGQVAVVDTSWQIAGAH